MGNPGRSYHDTRHNVGFAVIQLLAERRGVRLTSRLENPSDGRPAAVYGEYADAQRTVRLVMPLTMMNESGEAFRAMGSLLPERTLIVCDDVNLPLGALRLRPDGGAGGHHGLESCFGVLGTEGVPRLRLGVGAAQLPKELREYVLTPFPSGERAAARQMIAQAADACEVWVTEGIQAAMNRYNRTQGT